MLWLVTVFAIGLVIVTTRNILLQKTLEIETANGQIAKLRNDLGLIEVTDSEECHIRFFRDRYSDDISHWRPLLP